MSQDTVVFMKSLSDTSMRNGELHLYDTCEMKKVYAVFNEKRNVYAFVRECFCDKYKNNREVLDENELEECVPQNGIDVHANKDCAYRSTPEIGPNGGKSFRFKLTCYCEHKDRTRGVGEYNEP